MIGTISLFNFYYFRDINKFHNITSFVLFYHRRKEGTREEVDKMETLLTCKEIASRYKVSEDTVWRWIRTKKLAAVKVGSRNYRVRPEDLVSFEKSK